MTNGQAQRLCPAGHPVLQRPSFDHQ